MHTIFSSQFIWEVFLSCLNLESPTFHLKNPALQDSYYIFNWDCERVSQLPINFISFATIKLLFAYKHNNISRSILEYYAYTPFSLPYVPIFLPP